MSRFLALLVAIALAPAIISSCTRESARQTSQAGSVLSSLHAGSIQDVPAVGAIAERCKAIIPRLKSATSMAEMRPCLSSASAKRLLLSLVSMACPPSTCTEYEGWYIFSGGDKATIDDGSFQSGFAVQKSSSRIYRYE